MYSNPTSKILSPSTCWPCRHLVPGLGSKEAGIPAIAVALGQLQRQKAPGDVRTGTSNRRRAGKPHSPWGEVRRGSWVRCLINSFPWKCLARESWTAGAPRRAGRRSAAQSQPGVSPVCPRVICPGHLAGARGPSGAAHPKPRFLGSAGLWDRDV